jgi:hypothetical protein
MLYDSLPEGKRVISLSEYREEGSEIVRDLYVTHEMGFQLQLGVIYVEEDNQKWRNKNGNH